MDHSEAQRYICLDSLGNHYLRFDLIEASKTNDLERVKYLCEKEGYPFSKKVRPEDGRLCEDTPLHHACW